MRALPAVVRFVLLARDDDDDDDNDSDDGDGNDNSDDGDGDDNNDDDDGDGVVSIKAFVSKTIVGTSPIGNSRGTATAVFFIIS